MGIELFFQTMERLIQRQQIHLYRGHFPSVGNFLQRELDLLATAFLRVGAAHMIHHQPTHLLPDGMKEMRAILPVNGEQAGWKAVVR